MRFDSLKPKQLISLGYYRFEGCWIFYFYNPHETRQLNGGFCLPITCDENFVPTNYDFKRVF